MKKLRQFKVLFLTFSLGALIFAAFYNCESNIRTLKLNQKIIIGNPNYLSICYGGYRDTSRTIEPTIKELKEDLVVLSALGIKVLRTYQSKDFPQSATLLQAIQELKDMDSTFEMYVMLGAWIECEDAWTEKPNHEKGNETKNAGEVNTAVELAIKYPEIVKVIAVGNESMVHWAATYFVKPNVVLKWVNFLQKLKEKGRLNKNLKITSSDNYESWGGGDESYHNQDLIDLINAVDYVSMHTYPFHDTHYNPEFWHSDSVDNKPEKLKEIYAAIQRASDYAQSQYISTKQYVQSIKPDISVHIGETGWASISNDNYGHSGSKAADEYKQKIYFDLMNEWTKLDSITCFFFEAFDEPWKDNKNVKGSENHFGLIDIKGKVKYVIWNKIEDGSLKSLTRNELELEKSFKGNFDSLFSQIELPSKRTH